MARNDKTVPYGFCRRITKGVTCRKPIDRYSNLCNECYGDRRTNMARYIERRGKHRERILGY